MGLGWGRECLIPDPEILGEKISYPPPCPPLVQRFPTTIKVGACGAIVLVRYVLEWNQKIDWKMENSKMHSFFFNFCPFSYLSPLDKLYKRIKFTTRYVKFFSPKPREHKQLPLVDVGMKWPPISHCLDDYKLHHRNLHLEDVV